MALNNNNIYVFKNNDEREVEKYVGIDTYCTPSIQGIGGEYKTGHKDFIVKEILTDGTILEIKEDVPSHPFSENSGDKYTTFNLVKVNKDTFGSFRIIGKALKIPQTIMYYSGLKDKISISVQKISIRGNFVKKLAKLKLRDLFFRCITPTKNRVMLGSNWGNNFTIVIRNIRNEQKVEQNVDHLLKSISHHGFINYFGLQRFGYFRPNSHKIGRYILEANFKEAFNESVTTLYSTESQTNQEIRSNFRKDGDLENALNSFPRGMYYERKLLNHLIVRHEDYEGAFKTFPSDYILLLVNAFQSYIFNRMISLRIKKGYSLYKPLDGDVLGILDDNGHITQIRYIYGGLYDDHLKKAMNLNRASIILPIIGYDTNLDDFPLMKALIEEILDAEGITLDIFKNEILKKAEFKGSFRALTVKPSDLKFVELSDDDLFPNRKKLKIEFSIPKGSYATMLLREIIK